MSRLRRFFLVFVCFGYLIVDYFLCIVEKLYEQVAQILSSVRLFCQKNLISNRGTTAGEQTPFIVLCKYVCYTAYYKVYSFIMIRSQAYVRIVPCLLLPFLSQ